ncbi:MAG: restriction endonuclease subunit S [Clostridiaceae bacterium]
MSINYKKVGFKDFSKYNSIRLASYYELPNTKFPYDSFTEFIQLCESGSRPKGGINSEDYGQAISLGGEQIGKDGSVATESLPYVSYDFFDMSTKGRVKDRDILLCKDGALTGKVCMVSMSEMPTEKVMVNEHVYVVRANKKIKQELLYYLMRTPLFLEQIKDLAFRKKAQPGLSSEHIRALKIPEIPLPMQGKVLNDIFPLISEINLLRNKEHDIQGIIDDVFQNEFKININKLKKIDTSKRQTVSFSSFSDKNINSRFSYRWNKAVELQNVLSKEVDCCQQLGLHILNTQNGWSPACSEDNNSDFQVLGLDAINKSGILSFENPKFSSEYKKDIEIYIVSDGDFFVSRGNTTDLVSLASIAFIDEETPTTIYPDLMIKITFDSAICTMYMAYLINSFIGRFYFKYVTKGKNQTMVKVSPRELSDFIAPIPDISIQEKIVRDIQDEIKKQENIKNQISGFRKQIDDIIVKTISE